ncbi:MAG: glycerophosphodiester phosphodiesterase [Planctomycetota bacterium]|nr:glycerophosphodiester phosphodiesterase [Planctomycetota bacterium]
MPRLGTLLVGLAVCAGAAFCAWPARAQPIVIAHRGASGYRPEHTLAAYELAINQGADYIEPDLVMTRDGVLVCRHESEIGETTDVASRPEFAGRATTKVIDGKPVSGWFTEDFTLAELRTLRARERIPRTRPANTAYDGRFSVPTLQEVIDLVRRLERERGRTIGIYPEMKHPTYHESIGLPMERTLVDVLHANGYMDTRAACFVQCFEVGPLRRLNGMTELRLVQLLNAGEGSRPYDFVVYGDPRTYADLATPEGLAFIRTYADGVGASKQYVIARDASENLLSPTAFVREAHAHGLVVHVWTLRAEDEFLPANLKGDPLGEAIAYVEAGVDGFFTDHPDIGRRAVPAPGLCLRAGGRSVGGAGAAGSR